MNLINKNTSNKRKLNHDPLVSVGITCYNRPDELSQQLKSITNQSYKNLEIIISNDSPGNLAVNLVIDNFKRIDKRIQVFNQNPSLGTKENFLFVLNISQGNFFLFADDDDIYDTKFIEISLKNLNKNKNAVAAFSDVQAIDSNTNPIKYYNIVKYFNDWGSENKLLRIKHFFRFYEPHGRCLLLYSLHKKNNLVKLISAPNPFKFEQFRYDFIFSYNLLSSAPVVFSKEKLFKPRFGNEKKHSMESSLFFVSTVSGYKYLFFLLKESIRLKKFSFFVITLIRLIIINLDFIYGFFIFIFQTTAKILNKIRRNNSLIRT